MGSARSANRSSREAGYLLTGNEPNGRKMPRRGRSVGASAADTVRQAPRRVNEIATMVTILSIDGGGIRGLLPARVLQEIRRRLDLIGEKRPFSELFDLIAGTSSGALVALAVALRKEDGTERYSASEIVELYARRGTEIFPPSFRSVIHAAVQAFRHKYAPGLFERFLRDIFGDASLKSAATNLLITSFDTEAMQPHCMKRRPARGEWLTDPDYYMRDVARASSAAPTYFSSCAYESHWHAACQILADRRSGVREQSVWACVRGNDKDLPFGIRVSHPVHSNRRSSIWISLSGHLLVGLHGVGESG